MEFTNREVASAILLAGFVALSTVLMLRKGSLARALTPLLKALFSPRIIWFFVAYGVYVTVVVAGAWRLGLWEPSLLKDTLAAAIFVGLPLAFDAVRTKSLKDLLFRVLRDTGGLGPVAVFYVNLESFPLWLEVLVQALLAFLVALITVARLKPDTAKVAGCLSVPVLMLASAAFIYTVVVSITGWGADDWSSALKTLLLSVALPLALVPFVYCAAFLMACESISTRLEFFGRRSPTPAWKQFALTIGLRGSVRYASLFLQPWNTRLAEAENIRGALELMEDFRGDVARRGEAESSRIAELDANAGIEGVGLDGERVDRREFAETKRALTKLHYMMAGWLREGGFRRDILSIFDPPETFGLPDQPAFQVSVSPDGTRWMGWRQTVTGWTFGVGGDSDRFAEWQFTGEQPPDQFPALGAPGWVNATMEQQHPDWYKYDDPIQPS